MTLIKIALALTLLACIFFVLYICHWICLRITIYNLRILIQKEGYLERWNHIDLQVRNHKTTQDFLKGYLKSIRLPFIPFMSLRLQLLFQSPKQFGYRNTPIKILYFDPRFEGGMPHTHGPFIMLPYGLESRLDDGALKDVVFHESIHVYQRYNPLICNKEIVSKSGVGGIAITGFDNCIISRANPDTNRILYGDIAPTYKPNAKTLSDILDVRDHPYEMSAYAGEKNHEYTVSKKKE